MLQKDSCFAITCFREREKRKTNAERGPKNGIYYTFFPPVSL